MFSTKYPCITRSINNLTDNKLLINKINMINENTSNVLFINDYEITCKISQYYLSDDIPISRNSNTICIRTNYASYIYYLTIYILLASKNIQYFSQGEFMIPSDVILDIVCELNTLIEHIIYNDIMNDPLDELKTIFIKLLNNTFDETEYNYLYISRPNTPEEIISMIDDSSKEMIIVDPPEPEENNNVFNKLETIPESPKEYDFRNNSTIVKPDIDGSVCANKAKPSEGVLTLAPHDIELINDELYSEEFIFKDNSSSDSDGDISDELTNSDDFINNIKDNLVNILGT